MAKSEFKFTQAERVELKRELLKLVTDHDYPTASFVKAVEDLLTKRLASSNEELTLGEEAAKLHLSKR